MKKFIISLIIGAVLIGVGAGVFFMEIAEFSSTEYFSYIKEDKIDTFTFEDNGIFKASDGEQVEINVYLGDYFQKYGKYEIVHSPATEGVEISIDYRGAKPRFEFYDYGVEDKNLYSLHCYQSSVMPKEILDAARYIFSNKVIVQSGDMYIVEKVTIKTGNPELVKITY
ncbi:MAG: hypothetical protein IKU47_01300 [Oscillospiraceae bacterium]|nr:hypothetical protein [Oscillospiraceae bacterium]